MVSGPPLGYFPKPQKCWLIVKPEKERPAREIFSKTTINITTEGRKHLGAALGSRVFFKSMSTKKLRNGLHKLPDWRNSLQHSLDLVMQPLCLD